MPQIGATLRYNITKPIPTPPTIHLALVIGANLVTNTTVSAWLAQDTKSCLIDVRQYLWDISTMSFADQRELLMPLHPSMLHEYLRTGDAVRDMDAFFLTRILHRKLDAEVSRGVRSFLLVGLDNNFETAMMFAHKVVRPSAVIWLSDVSSGLEVKEMKIARHFAGVPTVKVDASPSEARYTLASIDRRLESQVSVDFEDEVTYRRLLAEIGRKAVEADTNGKLLYDRKDSVGGVDEEVS